MFCTYFINEEKTKFVSQYNGKRDRIRFTSLHGKQYTRTVKYYQIIDGKTFATVLYRGKMCIVSDRESVNLLP